MDLQGPDFPDSRDPMITLVNKKFVALVQTLVLA